MSQRKARIGTIIRLIANSPGITLSGLHEALTALGIEVSQRMLAKDIHALKHEYELLPKEERLRSGYVLEDVAAVSAQQMQIFAAQAESIARRDIFGKSERVQTILLAAIQDHLAVQMNYVTPRLDKPQTVHTYPLLMVFHERAWYCIARDLKALTFHPRRIDRIKSCSIMEGKTNDNHEQNLIDARYLLSCGWGMMFPRTLSEAKKAAAGTPIVVRFERTVAPYILESLRRHPFGTVSAARDGTGDALFKIRLSDPTEFLFWARSFGSKAWIVSPASEVERQRSEIRRMAKRY